MTHSLQILKECHSTIMPGQSCKGGTCFLSYLPFTLAISQGHNHQLQFSPGQSSLLSVWVHLLMRLVHPLIAFNLNIDYGHFQMDGKGMFTLKGLFSFIMKN